MLGDVPVYATRERALAAVAAVRSAASRQVELRLAATVEAARIARHLVDAACRSWRLDHLCAPATLIISELVSNAVRHAGTDLRVTAAYQGDHLRLSVHDGSWRPPVPPADPRDRVPLPEGGRGLFLIDVYASGWGSTPTSDGKTVWATLRTTPMAGEVRAVAAIPAPARPSRQVRCPSPRRSRRPQAGSPPTGGAPAGHSYGGRRSFGGDVA